MATGYVLVELATIPSTQDEARRRFEGSPVLVVAAAQTAGRGRGGSSWATAPRALAASLALRPAWPREAWGPIALVAGLAARQALGGRPVLKWPNDLVAGGRKVGGILVESAGDEVVVGLGVNLWWPDPPETTGAMMDEDPGPGEPVRLATAWTEALLDRLEAGSAAWGLDEYREACLTLGRRVRWRPEGEGTAVDVDPSGGLVIERDGRRELLVAGEVREVREA